MKTWIEVEARFSERPLDTGPFAEAFERFGCNSSLETEDPPAIKGYLESVNGSIGKVNELSQLLLDRGASDVTITEVPDEDWSKIWKQHFKPRRVGKRIVVVPSWEEFQAGANDIQIRLDPGQAFGTGEHPTTRLCLELLEELDPKEKTVLDIGCGSGILGIAAMKLGAGDITATDIDDAAIEIARENARVNGTEMQLHACEGFGDWSLNRKWNIVLSNIVSATLIRMAPEVARHIESSGFWIVSGVLQNNWKDVEAEAIRNGFLLSARKDEDDWVAAAFQRAL